MSKQELTDTGEGGESTGLAGGEMLPFGSEGFEFVGEGALETEKVGALDIRDDILSVGGIATIYISERGVPGSAGECKTFPLSWHSSVLPCTPLYSLFSVMRKP